MKNILDELEVPQPPYRMARPVARLAAAETSSPIAGADAAPMLEQIQPVEPEISDEERARKLAEQRVAEQDREWERFATSEEMDAAAERKVDETKQEIRSIPPPSSEPEAQNVAIGQVEDAKAKYNQEVSSREGRTPDQVMEEFKGERKKLNSVEDESESAEAALRRAEKAKDQKEIERLTKLTQSYSDVIEKKNTLEPVPKTKPVVDADREKLQAIRTAATEAVTKALNPEPKPEAKQEVIPPTSEQTAEDRYEAALKKVNAFRVDGKLSEATLKDKAFLEAERELIAARKALSSESKPEPQQEVVAPAPKKIENPDETMYRKPGRGKVIDADDAARRGEHIPGNLQEWAIKNRDEKISDLEKENRELKRKLQEREQAQPKKEQEQVRDFRTADSFDDIDRMLRAAETVQGSQKTFSANELLGIITDIRDIAHKVGAHTPAIEHALTDLPRTDGLRERVKELLDEEATTSPELPPTPPEQSPASPEQPQRPKEGGARDALREIEMMGDARAPDFWDRQAANIEASMHDVASWWSGIWAKRAKDKLARKDTQIKALEKKAHAMAEKSWLGTAFSPIVYGPRIAFHRWGRGVLAVAQEQHHDRRMQHENIRDEVLNRMALRMEGALKTHEHRLKELKKHSEALNKIMNEVFVQIQEINTQIAISRDPQEKMRLRARRVELESEQRRNEMVRERYEAARVRENEKSAKTQRIKNDILRGKMSNTRPNTKPEERERVPYTQYPGQPQK